MQRGVESSNQTSPGASVFVRLRHHHEPIELEGHERQTLVVIAFVDQADAAAFQAGEAAIARWAGGDQFAGGPGAALVVADADGQLLAFGRVVGVGEQQRAAL